MFLHSVGEDGVVFVGEFNPLGLSVSAAADEADNRLENADEVDEGEKRQQVDNGDIGAAAGHGGADDGEAVDEGCIFAGAEIPDEGEQGKAEGDKDEDLIERHGGKKEKKGPEGDEEDEEICIAFDRDHSNPIIAKSYDTSGISTF